MLVPLAFLLAAAQPPAQPPAPGTTPTTAAPAASVAVTLGFRWTHDAAGRYANRMEQQVVYSGAYAGTITQTQAMEVERTITHVHPATEPAPAPVPEAGQRAPVTAAPPAAGTRITDTIRRVAVSVKSGDTTIAFDSQTQARPQEPGDFDILRALLGKQTQFTVAADGTLADVKGLGEAVDQARTRASESPAAASILDQYKASMNDAAMKRTLEELIAIAPDRSVRVGETWSRTASVSMGSAGTLTVTSTHRLASVDAGKAIVRTESVLSLQAPAPDPAVGTAATFTLRDASGQGEAVIDTQLGVLLSRSYTLRLTLDSKAAGQLSSQSIVNKTEIVRQ